VIFPKLFEPLLLEEILQRVETARFLPRDHKEVGLELCMAPPDHGLVDIPAEQSRFPEDHRVHYRAAPDRRVQRPGLPDEFFRRALRQLAFRSHRPPGRTMSVNRSRQIYEGGALQLKLRDSIEILQETRNTGLGDALLFRISADLIHRVQGVTGDHPKIAFAGWFLQGEGLLANLDKRLSPPLQVLRKLQTISRTGKSRFPTNANIACAPVVRCAAIAGF